MENMGQILEYIARTNLFNFIIFAGIITFIIIKLDVKSKLEGARLSVEETINESETTKADSEVKLSKIEESMNHLSEEVDSILNQSEENAKLVGEKILEDTKKSAALIDENAAKAIENKTVVLKNDILRRASLASIEVAKEHIIEELNRNKDLHNKLIDESINEIEGIEP